MSLWSAIADLPLTIDGCSYAELVPRVEGERSHRTRVVELHGGDHTGLGEDITLFIGDGPFDYSLAGDYTLAGFCDHLTEIELWPGEPPEWDMARRWRSWAYESAALDLALQQAGKPLHEVVGREPGPITFVNSFGLGDPPSCDTVERRLAVYPDLRFKLDVAATWTPAICASLAATGAVEIIDFKGRYGLEVEDPDALRRVYAMLIDAFPDAILEDPHEGFDVPADRVSWDAPIATVADLDAHRSRTVNLKPSRIGSLRNLSDLYEACAERGIRTYGGGMGELGVARGQIQYLAALFHPDGPNDVAPPGYNDPEPGPGLPVGPLDPHPAAAGFQREVE